MRERKLKATAGPELAPETVSAMARRGRVVDSVVRDALRALGNDEQATNEYLESLHPNAQDTSIRVFILERQLDEARARIERLEALVLQQYKTHQD